MLTIVEGMTCSEAGEGITVMPDVRIPGWEERRPPRQCNLQKREVYC